MIILKEPEDGLSCNFCNERKKYRMFEICSDEPRKALVVSICSKCLTDLESAIKVKIIVDKGELKWNNQK